MELQLGEKGSQASDRCSDCVSTSVRVPALDYSKETSGQFPDMFAAKRDVDINSLIAVKNLND